MSLKLSLYVTEVRFKQKRLRTSFNRQRHDQGLS